MCGRFFINIKDKELKEAWDSALLASSLKPEELKKGEIFPTDIVPARPDDGNFRAMKWGFSGFARRPIINARSETILTKPTFRESALFRRCLIPASGYFEWKKEGSKKIKYRFYLPAGPLFLAACWREEKGSPLPSFVILTTAAAPEFSAIHDRMPVIVPQRLWAKWLLSPEDLGLGPSPKKRTPLDSAKEATIKAVISETLKDAVNEVFFQPA
jgi:putative SOS response-associated peptidase YedK